MLLAAGRCHATSLRLFSSFRFLLSVLLVAPRLSFSWCVAMSGLVALGFCRKMGMFMPALGFAVVVIS